jgi:hypothetical protein
MPQRNETRKSYLHMFYLREIHHIETDNIKTYRYSSDVRAMMTDAFCTGGSKLTP